MFTKTFHRGRTARLVAAAAMLLTVGVVTPAVASATDAAPADHQSAKPTIVLVHGAWADGSSFAPVAKRLQAEGYTVRIAPNPLRGLASDAAYLAAFVTQSTTGPVVLVGHSYGGAVITNAATSLPTVKSLVYVDAFAPDQGETTLELSGALPGSVLAVADPSNVFNFVQYPGAPTGDVDTYIKPELFAGFFAAHLPKQAGNALAAEQRPVTLSALSEASAAPAWKTLPSYFFVGTNDKIIPPAEQLVMAERAHGTVVKAPADHLSMLEQPAIIASLIERAAK